MKPKRVLKDESLQKSPKNFKKSTKKDKLWVVEWKWKSFVDYNSSPKFFLDKKEYTEDWNSRFFNTKFITLKSAVQSIGSYFKNSYRKDYNYKFWRVRNIKTKEIFEYGKEF